MAKKKVSKKDKIFRKGSGRIRKAGEKGKFLSIQPDDRISMTPLVDPMVDMISTDIHEHWDVNPFVAHPCLRLAGTKCPSCEMGHEPRFKAYLPVMLRDGDVKVFAFGISVYRKIELLSEELGNLVGKVLRVVRTGSGLKTRYDVIATGKKVNIDDVEEIDIIKLLGPTNYDEILELLESRGIRTATVSGSSKKSSSKEDWEDDEDDEDDDDWEDV